jgi:hypothetical protein
MKTNFHFEDMAASHATVAFVYIYVAWFALTWACVAWVYPAEVFAMNMRAKGTSITTTTNWFINFWFALYIPTAVKEIRYVIHKILCYCASTYQDVVGDCT